MKHKEGRVVVPGMVPKKKKKKKLKEKSDKGTLLSTLAVLQRDRVVSNGSTDTKSTATSPTAPSVDLSKMMPSNIGMSDNDRRQAIIAAMRNNLSDQQICMKFDTDLASVIRIRKDFIKSAKMGDPRALFAKRLADIDECFEVAKDNFMDNPASETNFRAMNDFARTLRELVQSHHELEDPKEHAAIVVKRVLRPLVMGQLRPICDALAKMQTDMSSYLAEHTRGMVETSVVETIRSLKASTMIEFNKAVDTTSQIYEVDMSDFRLTSPAAIGNDQDASE